MGRCLSVAQTTQTDKNNESTVFKPFVKQFTTREQKDPAIDSDLATIVNDLLTEKLTKGKIESVKNKYLGRENCEDLVSTKIKIIWQQVRSVIILLIIRMLTTT